MSWRWIILSGEYPPAPGGVSDYTRSVATALAAAGDDVHVMTAGADRSAAGSASVVVDGGVIVHTLPGRFGAVGRRMLGRLLDDLPRDARLLVQYVPHMYGARAMNLRLTRLLAREARRRPLDVMFHEVAFEREPGGPLRHRLLEAVTRVMARRLATCSSRVFASTEAWVAMLRRIAPAAPEARVTAIPSPLPLAVEPAAADAMRRTLAPRGEPLIGRFGTFGGAAGDLAATLGALLATTNARVALIGRGGAEWLGRVDLPAARGRVVAAGALPPDAAAAALAACDLVVQPYPDGVSTRRSSAAASLGLGLPLVVNRGRLSDAFWRDGDGVRLVDAAGDVAAAGARLLSDERARADLRGAARRLYARRFDLSHTIAALREAGGHG